MAVSVSKAGPYYASGQIKFSDLRRDFRAQQRKTTSGGSETFSTDTGSISASSLRRNTSTTNSNPIVPDSNENNNISTASNWKVSQFRNSIKYYYLTLPNSDTTTNFDIDALAWNGNLGKNINKFMFIDGTCGSTNISSPAAALNAITNNLTIDVYGSILGAGGRGGGTSGAPSISGENGGDALSILPNGGNNVVVFVRSGGRIYGGGGGGEKGTTGSNGSSGTCTSPECVHQYCAGSPNSNCMGCGGNYQYTRRPGCCRSTMRGGCVESVYQNICRQTQSSTTPTGGVGGNGGNGTGYTQSRSDGSGGGSGGCPSCPGGWSRSGGNCAGSGETGGNGGDWGNNGANTNNSGSGGNAGRAVTGSGYSVNGTINSTSIQGLYNP